MPPAQPSAAYRFCATFFVASAPTLAHPTRVCCLFCEQRIAPSLELVSLRAREEMPLHERNGRVEVRTPRVHRELNHGKVFRVSQWNRTERSEVAALPV